MIHNIWHCEYVLIVRQQDRSYVNKWKGKSFHKFCILVYECHELFTRFGTKGRLLIQALISYGLFQTVAAMIDLTASHFHNFFLRFVVLNFSIGMS